MSTQLSAQWKITLFGGLAATQGAQSVTRFRTRKTGLLLAYLALDPVTLHGREELADLLWPDENLDAARNSLRVSLASLRRQLEPPGVPAGAVVQSEGGRVGLNAGAIVTDVGRFSTLISESGQIEDEQERLEPLFHAVDLYRGDLLPGECEEWVLRERERLLDTFLGAVRRIVRCLARQRDYDRALEYGRKAVRADPRREEAHRDLMRLYAAAGQPAAAIQQYRELERMLSEDEETPSLLSRQLAEQLIERAGDSTRTQMKTAAGAPGIPPPAAPPVPAAPAGRVGVPNTWLPLFFSRFFGRENEMELIARLLSEPGTVRGTGGGRLVTLTGPGGTGKTRLAVEASARLRDQFHGGAWFVSLAEISDPALILDTVADSLGVDRSQPGDALQQVVDRLVLAAAGQAADGPARVILVLDNFEHLVEAGAAAVSELLRRVPSLTCLITSRRALGLDGEREAPIPPLPLPGGATPPDDLAHVPSVQLFVDRAQAIRPDYQVTRRNAADIAALCRRLEGLPLALELAAARARVLSPAQMVAHLDDRFELLVDARAGKDSRHRSLRATIQWSLDLLPPRTRRFFARLCVFQGGWTLEATAAVCGVGEPAAPEAPWDTECWSAAEQLEQLSRDSLVIAEESGGDVRYRMLDSLRQFGQELLPREELDRLRTRHATYFAAFAEVAGARGKGPEQPLWIARSMAELDNLRAALDWTAAADASELELRLTAAMGGHWLMSGRLAEGRARLRLALERAAAGGATESRARALNVAGTLAWKQGDYSDARMLYAEALEIRRQLGDQAGLAASLNNLGLVAREQGQFAESRRLLEEALACWRSVDSSWGIAGSLMNLGDAALLEGDYPYAAGLFRESVNLFEEQGNEVAAAMARMNTGQAEWRLGDPQSGRASCEAGLEVLRRADDRPSMGEALELLGRIHVHLGNAGSAASCLRESLDIRLEIGDQRGAAGSLAAWAGLHATSGDAARAASLLGAADRLYRSLGSCPWPSEQLDFDRTVSLARSALGEKAYAARWSSGEVLTLVEAAGLAAA